MIQSQCDASGGWSRSGHEAATEAKELYVTNPHRTRLSLPIAGREWADCLCASGAPNERGLGAVPGVSATGLGIAAFRGPDHQQTPPGPGLAHSASIRIQKRVITALPAVPSREERNLF